MGHRLLIGTSGWNYEHWRGLFYPRNIRGSDWLEFYSRYFATVEINYSFYRLPEASSFDAWREQVPDDFTFAVKASRYLTHRKKLKDPQEPIDRLFSRARHLGPKLGPALYQLPPRWHANVDRLHEFLSLLPTDVRHAVEFRDPSWLIDPVFELLTQYSVGYCMMSAPDLPLVMKVTAPFAYIRMHNGGHETDGNYEEPHLKWWAQAVLSLLETADVYVYFNNDQQGFAVRNALRLAELTSERL